MSRSGFSDDYDERFPNAGFLYQANVKRASAGVRGQKFFIDLLEALDAMPVKRLIAEELVEAGQVCAIGALGVARGIDMTDLNPEDAKRVGIAFKIAECLARQVVFENDEQGAFYNSDVETPEERWTRMRSWVETQIRSDTI